MKKIVLTGGGTAGHVTPHLALIPHLKKDYEIHYIGSKDGIEKQIISQHKNITYHEITCVKLVRSLTLKNLLLPFKLLKGIKESKKIIDKIKPDIVFSKGGFVAVPVVFASSKKNVPVISHESDISMGLANKLILKKCLKMCCSFKKTTENCKNKCIYTGTPIREEMFNGKKEVAQNACNFKNNDKPVLLFMGGSLGAKAINEVVIKSLNELSKTYNIIHIVGKGNLTKTKNDSYFQVEFVSDIENYLALSSAVISRAGSNSINEFLALKKPMLLIPLPLEQSRGDQIENAKEFEKNNYCMVLVQKNLTPENLIISINQLIKNKTNIMSSQSKTFKTNATQTIISLINKFSN